MDYSVYTVPEVAKMLRVNKNMIYKLIKSGHLKAIKLGTLKITSRAVEEFLSCNEGNDFGDFNNVKPLPKTS